MKKIISITLVIILIGLVVWKLAANKQVIDSKKEIKVVNTSVAVTVKAAEMMQVNSEMNFVGTTDAVQKVNVSPETSGKIIEINFKEGDYLTKGKVMIRLDDRLNQLALSNAQLAYTKYKHDYEKFQVLRQSDAVSENQLLDMKLAYENAEIQVQQAKKMLENTKVVAPFSGFVTKKYVDMGAFVAAVPATPLADIIDIAQLKITFSVSESDAYALKKGQEVQVTAAVFPDMVFKGKITFISAQGDKAHTYPVEVAMDNQSKVQLKAGTYVKVVVPGTEVQSKLVIPRDAIISSIKDASVYVLDGDVVRLKTIITGKEYGDFIEVVAQLKEGEKVVTNGQINLSDGASVTVKN